MPRTKLSVTVEKAGKRITISYAVAKERILIIHWLYTAAVPKDRAQKYKYKKEQRCAIMG